MGLYPWRLSDCEVVLAVVLEADGAVRLVFVWGVWSVWSVCLVVGVGLWVNATDNQRLDYSWSGSLRQVVKVGLLVCVGYVDRG